MTLPRGGSRVVFGALPLAGLLLAGGCSQVPQRRLDATDPSIYGLCADPAARAAWERANLALAKGDDVGALPDLIACGKACPDFVRGHVAYQDCARRLGGEVERAMVTTYLSTPERPSPVPAYLKARLADTPYAQCNALEAILKRDPSFAWAHLSRGRVTRLQGRLLPALDMLAAAAVNDPELHEAKLERAQVLAELGRDAEAATQYRAYLHARPDDLVAVHEFVTLLLYRFGRFEEASPWIDRLERATPGALSVRMDRAAAFWGAGRHRDAVDIYLSVLQAAPNTSRAALNIGLLYYEVVPQDEAARRRFWPRARLAFDWFLATAIAAEGHEQFERTLGVPFRLARIAELLGLPAASGGDSRDVRALSWPDS
jgi:tetratricopeptide (TPR) repeat protein